MFFKRLLPTMVVLTLVVAYSTLNITDKAIITDQIVVETQQSNRKNKWNGEI